MAITTELIGKLGGSNAYYGQRDDVFEGDQSMLTPVPMSTAHGPAILPAGKYMVVVVARRGTTTNSTIRCLGLTATLTNTNVPTPINGTVTLAAAAAPVVEVEPSPISAARQVRNVTVAIIPID